MAGDFTNGNRWAERGLKVTWCVLAIVLAIAVAADPAAAGGRDHRAKQRLSKPSPGTRDRSFGRGGVAMTAAAGASPAGTTLEDASFRGAEGGDGEIFVLSHDRVLSFDPDGHPDPKFGKRGRLVIPSGPGKTFESSAIAVDSRGRVVVAGTEHANPPVPMPGPDFVRGPEASVAAVFRFLPDGSPDPSFGTGGRVETDLGAPKPKAQPPNGVADFEYEAPAVGISGLALDSEDRPVISGSFVTSAAFCFANNVNYKSAYVARLTVDGARDAGFGGDGPALPGETRSIPSLTVAPRDGIVALTAARSPCAGHGSGETRYGLTALSPGGQPETGFASDVGDLLGTSPAIDGAGRILVASGGDEAEPRVHLARLNPDGRLDPSFGTGGQTTVPGASALAVDRHDRPIVAIGESPYPEPESSRFELLRLTRAGRRDHAFGSDGTLHSGFGGSATGAVQSLWVDNRNRVLVGGAIKSSRLKGGSGVALARYLSK